MTEQDAADAETDAGEDEVGAADEERVDESTAEAETDGEVDDELVERIADSDAESIARELSGLRARVDELEATVEERDDEVEELESKLKRKQADFQNFKKRMEKRQEQQKKRATEDLVSRLLDVRDNLRRALDQDEDVDIRDGVESTLRQFDDVLDAEDVEVVEPEPGAEVDPERHQVLARVDSDQPEGTIADVHRPGYLMADAVLREAQVTVSDGE
ncbi:nucleotide exchange factor GrpE [Halomicrobium salinisoli]|uniref:nucleotide exchange factor GrpE n=1 Tax=Halomicrobium salinisoli TaxID=2878391 RepID=UPI001CF01533|nr:nucleotide exchange factor GrpE [Halomicrobium salinisoli]